MLGTMQDRPLTLTHFFERAERHFPDKEIVTGTATGVERSTYGEWAARTRRLGGVLDDLGISPDGRVATFAWNTARHLELYFAAPCSGRVLHTLNIRLFPEQLTYIVNHAEDEVIFVDRSLLGLLAPLLGTFRTVRHVVVMDDGAPTPDPDGIEVLDHEELLASASPVDFRVDDERRAASMCYTSGTTGNPKGVVYTHRSTYLHTLGVVAADAVGVGERDVVLPVVPMFHANAWGLAHAGVATGASLVLPGPRMTPPALAELIESERVTIAAGVPTIWMGVLPELEGRDISALRMIPCGGSAVPKVLSESYRAATGLPILQAWGMTETSPVASVATIRSWLEDRSDEELADLRATQGPALLGVELRIADQSTGEVLAVGRRVAGRAASGRSLDRRLLLRRSSLPRVVHRGRLAAHRRCRGHHARRLRADRRPDQGRGEVGRRVDLVGRARERDHGAPVGRRGSGHRRAAPEVVRTPARLRGGARGG